MTNIRKDVSLVSFEIYGLLPVAVTGIFTNIRSVYGAPFLLFATITMIAGAAAYILLGDHFQRFYVLAAAMTMTWIISGIGSATFWHGKQAAWMQQPANGFDMSLEYVIYWGGMLALMLLPLLVIVIKRATAKV